MSASQDNPPKPHDMVWEPKVRDWRGADGHMAAAAVYSRKELNKLKGSSPINLRLVLLNGLLVGGCAFLIFESIRRYEQSLDDLDRVARLAASGNAPCGLAAPRTKFIMQSLQEISDDPFTEQAEAPFVSRTRGAFCAASAVSDALRSALQTLDIPEACCNGLANAGSNAPPAPPAIDIDQAVKDYVCNCGSGGCPSGGWYGDFMRRIAISYVQSAPAFARYVDSGTQTSRCTNQYDPWAESVCTDVDARTLIETELNLAASNSMDILAGGSEPFPAVGNMLYRLMALSVVEFHDRTDNNGACFKNTLGTIDAVQFCTDMLATSVNTNGRPVGTQSINGCVDPAKQRYYVERIGYADACDWTAATGTEEDRLKIEPDPRALRRFSDAYKTAAPVYAVCASTLEFGLLDRRRLFGIPDVVSKFDWYGANHGNSFTRWISGWMYYALFDANVKKVVVDTHSAYIDLKLYIGYRLAATAAWAIAAVCAAGYLLAFALVPLTKLLYIRFVRRNLTASATKPIVLKPMGAAEYAAILTTLLVGLWVLFVDPAAYTPYIVDASCEDYALHGGAFPTTESRPRDGPIGLVLLLLSCGLLVYLAVCRKKPRKDRVMPLKPFSTLPIIGLIFIILISVFILTLRAGSDWWVGESTSRDQSSVKSTTDLEDIITSFFWSMLFVGMLLGVLNQRSMAANAVLEVPRGRPPVFAFLWVVMGLAAAGATTFFLWGLFDCQLAWNTNHFICGDGTETNTRWSHFFGAIAFGAGVLSVVFVVFASYRVIFKVPRKNDVTALAFEKSRQQKVNQLAAQNNAKVARVARERFGLNPPPVNPFNTAAKTASDLSNATGAGGAVSASFVMLPHADTAGGAGELDLLLRPQSAPIGRNLDRV